MKKLISKFQLLRSINIYLLFYEIKSSHTNVKSTYKENDNDIKNSTTPQGTSLITLNTPNKPLHHSSISFSKDFHNHKTDNLEHTKPIQHNRNQKIDNS